jgi:hypothetical protein
MAELPACGLYRTTVAIGGVGEGHLVYFHNHGDPGPGIYRPESWSHNRATFSKQGTTLPDNALAATLKPLPPEGMYVVERELTCCEKRCQTYAADTLVQLGYNGHGQAILFTPTLTSEGMALPTRGTAIDDERLDDLKPLKVREDRTGGGVVH